MGVVGQSQEGEAQLSQYRGDGKKMINEDSNLSV
jgi:hypothetical protein